MRPSEEKALKLIARLDAEGDAKDSKLMTRAEEQLVNEGLVVIRQVVPRAPRTLHLTKLGVEALADIRSRG